MGCDIHFYVEAKRQGGGWEWVGKPYFCRDYDIFSMMADCGRGRRDLIAENRGLPDDVSIGVELECRSWGEDGHSHSWLTMEEMKLVQETQMSHDLLDPTREADARREWHVVFGDFEWRHVGDKPLLDGIEDFRAVFWFDN